MVYTSIEYRYQDKKYSTICTAPQKVKEIFRCKSNKESQQKS